MTPDEIIARYPQFASVDVTVIQTAIDDADPFFNVCRWRNFYEQGLAAFVAHNLTLAAGPVDTGDGSQTARVSKSIGEVSVSYSSGMVDKYAADPFMRTVYGQKYKYLARLVGMGAVAV